MSGTALIGLDWGTTSARAYRIDARGEVLDVRSAALGIQNVRDGAFDAALATLLGDWQRIDAPRLACGMIGSRQGWLEAPYCETPVSLAALGEGISAVPRANIGIVPGVRTRDAHGMPDVMRGEETQIFGAMARSAALSSGSVAVLPGTHSKWVRVAGRRIERFTTYITGELFGVLSQHSILGRLAGANAGGAAPGEAFRRGVQHARDVKAGLASLVFSARSAVLVGDLPAEDSLEYLSGVLIGDEIRAGLASGDRPRVLIGEPALCDRYATALREFGMTEIETPGDTAPAGLWQIALRALAELQRADGASRRPVSE